jgi:hypothetical protein
MSSTTLLLILFLSAALPAAVGWLLRRQTQAKGDFGIGPLGVACPRCGAAQAFVRKPASIRQMLFGGYTCQICGCEMDKYGRAMEG